MPIHLDALNVSASCQSRAAALTCRPLTRTRIILAGFGLVVLLLAVVGYVSHRSLTALIAAQDRQERSLQARLALNRVVSLLADGETAQRGFVITGDEAFLEPYTNAVAELPAQMERVEALAQAHDQIGPLTRAVEEKLRIIESHIVARKQHGQEFAEAQISGGEGKRAMDQVRRAVARMDDEEMLRLRDLNARLDHAAREARRIVWTGSLLALLTAGFSLDQVRRAFAEKRQARAAVERANAHLEDRVQERTLMLSDALGRLKAENEERKQLEAEVLRISEREQRRIAQDLHDGLGQMLAGALHLTTALEQRLAAAASPEASEAKNLRQLMKESLEQTRATARGLYPVKDIPKGLMVALKDLSRTTEALFEIDCEFLCPAVILFENNGVATHLYRIAQEAVSNAIKHGRADRVRLVLTGDEDKLILEVRDNGSGFAPESSSRNGLGTRIMQQRAEMSGGKLSVAAPREGGVIVRCEVPRG